MKLPLQMIVAATASKIPRVTFDVADDFIFQIYVIANSNTSYTYSNGFSFSNGFNFHKPISGPGANNKNTQGA